MSAVRLLPPTPPIDYIAQGHRGGIDYPTQYRAQDWGHFFEGKLTEHGEPTQTEGKWALTSQPQRGEAILI